MVSEPGDSMGRSVSLRLIVSVAVVVIVVVIAAYVVLINDGGSGSHVPAYDQLPETPDGVYDYEYQSSWGDGIVHESTITYSGGHIVSATIDGAALSDIECQTLDAWLDGRDAKVETGSYWTDGTTTVGSYTITVEGSEASKCIAENGLMLFVSGDDGEQSFSFTLSGWHTV